MVKLPSQVMEEAVSAFSRLPGIGRKTALRLVLHLMKQDEQRISQFAGSVLRLKQDIQYCTECHNVAEGELCSICQNPARQAQTICVVESLRDLIAIEQTQQYGGRYHILGGVISPIEGIGPEHLNLDRLFERAAKHAPVELIMALNPTIEGDTTAFYISSQIQKRQIPAKLTSIARGIAFGGELEYTDELTLARSLANRLPYNNQSSAQ